MTYNSPPRRGQGGVAVPWFLAFAALGLMLVAQSALAHGVTLGDKDYIQEITGVRILPFLYLGAKHMVTGYDHLLFLFGIVFFLYGMKHIAGYVSLFAFGHSTTMLIGVYFNIGINSYIIDAIIGFSVVYKALDNLGALSRKPRHCVPSASSGRIPHLPVLARSPRPTAWV